MVQRDNIKYNVFVKKWPVPQITTLIYFAIQKKNGK